MMNWYWNTRGGCVEIVLPEAIRTAVNNGFVPLTEEERMRYKPGMYHPGHDMGDGSTVAVSQPQKDPPKEMAIGDFHPIEI